ncbi:MAG TPA: V-type ATP synthase subunit E [Trueperaceae bacterium]|jgi:V/A-type H+-transporting ATPase subunit E
MADLSTLLAKEASTEIEAILSEANERAAKITEAARSEAESIVAERERRAKAQREAGLVRARSAAQLEASAIRLRAQHEGVRSVFEEVRRQLDALVTDQGRYPGVFEKLLDEALAAAREVGVASVEVAPADVELARSALASRGVSAEVRAADDVRGGVRVRTTRRSAVENTLYDRLDAMAGELAAEVSKALFGAKAE